MKSDTGSVAGKSLTGESPGTVIPSGGPLTPGESPGTVILANGSYPRHRVPLAALRQAKRVVCCDGAVKKLVDHGMQPDVIVGDLDSLPPSLQRRYSTIVIHDTDQETNDLTKAVSWCIAAGITEITIVGATGLREDHTLANISLLADYNRSLSAVMFTDTGLFRVLNKSATIASAPGQQVSLFAIDPLMEVTSDGLLYPLESLTLNSWWRGTLNEAAGDSFSLYFRSGQVIVFMPYI